MSPENSALKAARLPKEPYEPGPAPSMPSSTAARRRHLKVGQPPIVRLDGDLSRSPSGRRSTGAPRGGLRESRLRHAEALRHLRGAGELDTPSRGQVYPASASTRSASAATVSFAFRVIPGEVPTWMRCSSPGRRAPRRGAPRPRPRHRRHRRRQDDDARAHARPHQPYAPAAHRHDRGPDRDPAHRRELHRRPARGRARHRLLPRGPAPRAAPGPGRHPDRRAPRRRDGRDRPPGGRVGHLVFSTMHTVDAAETVGRLVEFFPAIKQPQVRSILAGVLKGVVSQRLLPRADGGRIAAVEVIDHEQPHRRPDPREQAGVHPRGDRRRHVLRHADAVARADRPRHRGDVDRETAANAAPNRHDFLIALEHALKQTRLGHRHGRRRQRVVGLVETSQSADALGSLRIA